MAPHFNRKGLNLKWLELFQICARKGSVQATAQETGLSISTVSYHLKSLEEHLGVNLLDHARRPVVLTPKGQAFLANIDDALLAIRKAQTEATAGDVAEARHLRIGSIEDLDSDIVPELASHLSSRMPGCDFLYHTATSHEVIEMLRNRQLDMGITTSPPERHRDLQERPLLRDPFVLVLPRDTDQSLPDIVGGSNKLPFLRFSSDLIIARQIEAQLRRLGIALAHQFACNNNQTLMGMVASGAGWTITTPLLFSRAQRFHQQVQLHPFPGKSFARRLSLLATQDSAETVLDLIDERLRASLEAHVIMPSHKATPWLVGQFTLIDPD
ncbi:LysR family transcriptional regulator [Yoonia sp. GPGPB17]|uniref:LysR family transcriptional regulator n=1 Tax=Yoonia sp. GPGPB17 TaxID=3026147 RepID=UPI0030BF93CD